jgi:hypothetical protein
MTEMEKLFKRLVAIMDAERKARREDIRSMWFETTNTRKETTACQEMEAHLEDQEPTLVDMKSEAAE